MSGTTGRRGTHIPSLDRFIRTEERRAFRRWPVRVSIECRSPGERSLKADVLEMSEVGLTFTAEHDFEIGDVITLHCYLSKHGKPINIKAAVRQMRGRTVGTEFLNLRLKDRLRIQDFFSAHAKGSA